ncbi:hypothetical protein [Actinacidiphila yeochonensis]|uniref:hypothetical protein n=1 Tax=Actinacidiphila yeochonensis TaxID=89050 RepID=UPI00055FF610|nr:hypothetical protein [Actinacidiphila yeochonensis]
MRSNGSRTSGRTLFEQELVNAMNDFVNTAETPTFDTAAIASSARRKRVTAVAGIAAALIAVGAGTALAATAKSGSQSTSAASSASQAASGSTTLRVEGRDGTVSSISLAGANSARARAVLVNAGLTPSFTRTHVAGCAAEGAVISVSPHAPTVVHVGDTILVSTCY